jgi:hypothetical protein
VRTIAAPAPPPDYRSQRAPFVPLAEDLLADAAKMRRQQSLFALR